MRSAALSPSSDRISSGHAPSGARHLLTSSGESRSELYRRLRSEGAWDIAEEIKEAERERCRSAGMTKAQACVSAWDSISVAFPPVDILAWYEFHSRSLRPPFISEGVDLPHETAAVVGGWCATIRLSACVATRCPSVANHSEPILKAIDSRRSLDSSGGRILSEAELRKPIDFMIESPDDCLRAAGTVFSQYEPPESEYGRAVADELTKLIGFMELLQETANEHWGRIRPWLFGPRQHEAERFLARACEKEGVLSTPKVRKAR